MRSMQAMKNKALQEIFQKYSSHPEFLGIEILDVNQPGAVDDTLLHIAARTGQLDEMKVLIAHGSCVNCIGDLGNTPLHQAAMGGKTDAVKLLLKSGANPQIKNEFDQTAAEVAQIGRHDDLARLLSKR